jgi:ABC-type multidrug transport system ATPase subunit
MTGGGETYCASELTVRYGKKVALQGVSLAARPGEVTAVVGGDGAGKTTLLRCFAGSLAPHSGTVRRPPKERGGYFPASSGLYPDLTVTENLDFRATGYGLSRQEGRQRAAEYLERAGLTAAAGRLVGQLSGGMRQKLGVIAAMLHQPELLVLDEPTTGVDPVSRSGLWWLIARAAADGCAVVFATSYLDEAERCASVLVLDSGIALTSGTPQEIIAGMSGGLRELPAKPEGAGAELAWRRGGHWLMWDPDQQPGQAADQQQAGQPGAEPDLADAVTVAALGQSLHAGGARS